jgi:signal transduction histidine kinase
VKVRDDGVGFDVAAGRERALAGVSLGLLGMEERVSSFDGELEVQSAPGNGTEIVARFCSAVRV